MARCLGLDLGSTSIKAAILNLETGQVERIVSRPFPGPRAPQSGWFEIDVDEVASRPESSSLNSLKSPRTAIVC